MKRTYKQITDTLEQVTVEHDSGEQIVFLNGVIQQMSNNGKFIAARGPVQGSLMLIISDYAHYAIHEKEIDEWLGQFSGGIRREGMILTFDHDADRTAFLLKWG